MQNYKLYRKESDQQQNPVFATTEYLGCLRRNITLESLAAEAASTVRTANRRPEGAAACAIAQKKGELMCSHILRIIFG